MVEEEARPSLAVGDSRTTSKRLSGNHDTEQEAGETAIITLVDDTELVDNQYLDASRASNPATAAAASAADVQEITASSIPRKQAWIQVVDDPVLSAETSIFTFVPLQVVAHDTGDDGSGDNAVQELDAGTPQATATALNEIDKTASPMVAATPSSHSIQIDPLLDQVSLELTQALQAEKTYSVPVDIPEFGWLDCFQLGARLTYVTMLLRRDISPRILCLDEEAVDAQFMVERLSAMQMCVFAHAGLAFNSSTQSLTIRQLPPPTKSAKSKSKSKSPKRRMKKERVSAPCHKQPAKQSSGSLSKLSTRFLASYLHSHTGIASKTDSASNPSKTDSASNPSKIGDRGAIAIFRALRVNKSLLSLSMQHVGLGDEAGCALAAMLRCNSTLTHLDLQGNHIGPLGIQALCDAVEDIPDSMLLRLDLSYNRITDAGVPFLCRALRENETLVWLNVSWNQLTSPALLNLLEALRDNFVLSDVAIYGRDCDEDQYCQNHESKYAKRIAAALRCVNECFDELRLTSSRACLPIRKVKQSRWVTLPGTDLMEVDALVIAGLLPLNTKLLTLDLSDNPAIERWAILEVLASIKHCKTLRQVNLANTGLHEEVAELVAELIASNDTLASITMHSTPIEVQEARGCHADRVVEVLQLTVPKEHHFDRWILAKCLALNRPTQELNGIRLPIAPAVTTGSSSKLVSVNLSGRPFDMHEVAFLSKKVFHHLHIGRLALNNCGIESYGGAALADGVRNHAVLETLELEHNSIGIAGGVAMAECVQYNSSLTYLNLSWNKIGNDGAIGLREALKANRTLLRLDLRGNNLGASAIIAISDGLQGNARLKELYLRWNVICPRGAEALAQALTVNKMLRLLDIEHHTMGEAGARAFALMLEKNNTLQDLNMKGDDAISDGDASGIGAERAQQIAIALTEKNRSLTNLNIAQNQIGNDGVVWFSNLLKLSKTLKVLDLSLSGMDGKVAPRFFECLSMNKTLEKLNLAHNRISNEGMMACIKALEANKVLMDLNLTDNLITEEPFALLLQKLRSPKTSLALKWLCIADNSMTDRTYQALRALQMPNLTILLEEDKHRLQ